MRQRIGSVILVSVICMSGCVTAAMQQDAARVRVLEPRPLVDLPESSDAISLALDSTIPDSFLVPEQNGITAVPVEQWHASLQNGFKNGIARFYRGDATAAAWKLVLLNAQLDYVPTAVAVRGVQTLGAVAVQARLRYIARLVDATGNVIARDQGEVFSTNHWTQSGGSSTTAAEAVAAMYENIAKQIGSAPNAQTPKAQNPEQHASTS
jgi:hypothetical protein